MKIAFQVVQHGITIRNDVALYCQKSEAKVAIQVKKPKPSGTKKFLYCKLIRYCKATMGKQATKKCKPSCRKYINGIGFFG